MNPGEEQVRIGAFIGEHFPDLDVDEVQRLGAKAGLETFSDWEDLDLLNRLFRSAVAEEELIRSSLAESDETEPIPDWLKEQLSVTPKIIPFPKWIPAIVTAAAVIVLGVSLIPYDNGRGIKGIDSKIIADSRINVISPGLETILQQPVISWNSMATGATRVAILSQKGEVLFESNLKTVGVPVIRFEDLEVKTSKDRLTAATTYLIEIEVTDDKEAILTRKDFRVVETPLAETPVPQDLDQIEKTIKSWLERDNPADAVGWLRTVPENLNTSSRIRQLRIEAMKALKNRSNQF